MIQIDGSMGEGGGSVLRTSLALSMITGEAVHLTRIRARRRNPGLAPQHLAGVLAASQICAADVKGAKLRSDSITFKPSSAVQAGAYHFDISQLSGQGSAGAVTLLLQTILLPLALADGKSHLIVRGGTHVNWSPPAHYMNWVLLPTLKRMGVEAKVKFHTLGWFPQGGGQLEITIQGNAQLSGLDLSERGDIKQVQGVAIASNLPSHIPQRIANRANNLLKAGELPGKVRAEMGKGPSTGVGIVIAAEYEQATVGYSALGERGKSSEQVANEAADALLYFDRRDWALDPYLPDQILAALTLASGESQLSTIALTQHTLTNVDVIGRFLDRSITVDGQEDSPGSITVGA